MDTNIWQTVHKEIVDPIGELVWQDVMEGKTVVDTTLSAEEKHQKVFTFISGEAKQIIASTMK